MEFHSVGNIQNNSYCQILRSSKIWNKKVESISHTQLLAVQQLLKMRHGETFAYQTLNVCTQEALSDYVLGKIDYCDLVAFTPNKPTPTLEKIIKIIEAFEPMVQRALMFAIYTGADLSTVGRLTYRSINKIRNKSQEPYSEGADYILQTQPRHLHTNFVFWEFNRANIPTPFLCLEKEFLTKSGFAWFEFYEHLKRNFDYSCQAEQILYNR